MSCNHAKLLEQARAAGLSEDELDVMAEELQHDPGAEETEDEQELIPKIAPIKRKCQVGLSTVTVYGYDRTVYGWLTGTNRPVHVPYIAHPEA
jgi:hypothetical protein